MRGYKNPYAKPFGRYFPSGGEGRRGAYLLQQEKAKEIKNLTSNPSIELLPGINWKLDSSYEEKGIKGVIYEEFKGVMSAEVRLKTALWRYIGPGTLRFIGERGTMFYLMKEVIPLGIKQLICDVKKYRR